MKKVKWIGLALLLAAGGLQAQPVRPQSAHVVTHQRTTIVTDPSKGENSYKAWGVFPAKSIAVRRIYLHLTLGSPDTMPTAHWDYCDKIRIRRAGGKNAPDLAYELGRMLTPYGSIFGKGWQWSWRVEVTDFAPLLRDSVEIEYLHTGYEPTTVGWALTLDFEIEQGNPVAKPLGMVPLWNAPYKYGNPEEPIEKSLTPVSYTVPGGSHFTRVRIQHTGHGADRPRNCSEFCSRWREIYQNDKRVDRRDMWKACGDNPLYPQGGTWIYNRAYWCPGDLQQPDLLHLLVKPGSAQTLKMVMEPYTATANIQAEEQITSFAFHYSKPLARADVAVEEIVVPTQKQQFFRYNPSVQSPRIVIRNLGSEPLKTVDITYGTEGFGQKKYRWQGYLSFYEATEVVLPGAVDARPGATHNFGVSLSLPAGSKDEWPADNQMQATFKAARTLPQTLLIAYKTNKAPGDNHIFLRNAATGDTLWQRRPSGTLPDTLYTDTLRLPVGAFTLALTDTGHNGLQFWAQPRQGDGYLRLLDTAGRLIHLFESDCGSGEQLAFYTDPNFKADTARLMGAFQMFPRRTTDKIELDMLLNKAAPIEVKITVDGLLQQHHQYTLLQKGKFTYHIGYLPKGRFVVEVWSGAQRLFTGRVNRD